MAALSFRVVLFRRYLKLFELNFNMLIMKILTDSVDFTEPTNAFMEGLLKTSRRHMVFLSHLCAQFSLICFFTVCSGFRKPLMWLLPPFSKTLPWRQ
jgi:hypothetical protein